jgi:predicted ATPase
MLESIHLKNVGPAPEMKLDLAPRLNLITGDNGLGKSFLLDVAWWVLTRTWSGYQVRPSLETVQSDKSSTIAFSFEGKQKQRAFESTWVPQDQEWTSGPGRPADPGLVIYARVDGGFAVWDPVRNQKARELLGEKGIRANFPALYAFARDEVWDGLRGEGTEWISNGLVRDWVLWQSRGNGLFTLLSQALDAMSEPGEPLQPGKDYSRISINDARDYPTIRTSHGEEVAIVLASAAVRRIAALAYLIVWTWSEHERMSKQLKLEPTKRIVFLIDEVETHLHPRWQRTIVPSLLRVVNALAPDADVQLLVSTHAPLVLASVEASFDRDRDAWFDLDLDRTAKPPTIKLTKRPYIRHGEIGNWLVSDAFDLKEPRSLEGEKAVAAAETLMQAKTPPSKDAVRDADEALRTAGLPDIDTFWVRWRYFRDEVLEPRPKETTK